MGKVPERADSQVCVGEGMISNDSQIRENRTMSLTIRRGTLSKAETAARTRQGRQPE